MSRRLRYVMVTGRVKASVPTASAAARSCRSAQYVKSKRAWISVARIGSNCTGRWRSLWFGTCQFQPAAKRRRARIPCSVWNARRSNRRLKSEFRVDRAGLDRRSARVWNAAAFPHSPIGPPHVQVPDATIGDPGGPGTDLHVRTSQGPMRGSVRAAVPSAKRRQSPSDPAPRPGRLDRRVSLSVSEGAVLSSRLGR